MKGKQTALSLLLNEMTSNIKKCFKNHTMKHGTNTKSPLTKGAIKTRNEQQQKYTIRIYTSLRH